MSIIILDRLGMEPHTYAMSKKPPRPRDANQLAKFIVDVASGETDLPEKQLSASGKNPAAVELGRLGGLKGGKARSEKLSPEEKKAIAQTAARMRWKAIDDREK